MKQTLNSILIRAQKTHQAKQESSAQDRTRVYGPYPDGNRWRIVLLNENGERVARMLDSREEADEFLRSIEQQVQTMAVPRTMGEALAEYLADRQSAGLKPLSIRALSDKLRSFLPLTERLAISAERAAQIYAEATTRHCRLHRPPAAATHRRQLRYARTFYSWCLTRGYLVDNPFRGVKPIGQVNSGKPQLRLDEVRKLVAVLQKEGAAGNGAAVALLLQLVLGTRSSEILGRVVRDVDDNGQVLWIPSGKTRNARRCLSIPEEIQPLVRTLTNGRPPDAYLLGQGRTKPYPGAVLWKQLRRCCRLAGVRQVCPHSLHSTLAIEAGATSGAVIAQLGHSSFRTTEKHYVDPARMHNASMRRVTSAVLGAREDLQGQLDGLSADELRELLAAIKARRSAA